MDNSERTYKLTVTAHPDTPTSAKASPLTLQRQDGETVMDALRRCGYFLSAVCGGRGKCGKCGVRFTKNAPAPQKADRKFYSDEQLTQGWRLACLAIPDGDAAVELPGPSNEESFDIISESVEDLSSAGSGTVQSGCHSGPEPDGTRSLTQTAAAATPSYDIAIDIGTTTLVLALTDASAKVIDTVSAVNRQRAFGADVISRIQASNEGNGPALRESIQKDLLDGIARLLERSGADPALVRRVVISGNTTMGHLLLGFSCETLGVVPFTPVDISLMRLPFENVFGSTLLSSEVIFLPGVTTYVGADITAGMYAYDLAVSDDISFLIDLGTNGEMALGNKDRLLVTSTAAGPAFEGGNITFGCGSIRGAICGAEIKDGKMTVETIQGAPPAGICGTGAVEITDALLKAELLDETGVLDDDYFDDGYPVAEMPDGRTILFTQKDVREIQLAKAAVRAGAETLLLRYGIGYEDVAHVYLAGGFGYRMDRAKAVGIGLLPEEFEERILAVGNSSLRGALKYLADPDGDRAVQAIAEKAEEVSLSADKSFNGFYMDSMMFESALI